MEAKLLRDRGYIPRCQLKVIFFQSSLFNVDMMDLCEYIFTHSNSRGTRACKCPYGLPP